MGSKKLEKFIGIHQQPLHTAVQIQPGAQEVPPYRAPEAGKELLSWCPLLCSFFMLPVLHSLRQDTRLDRALT